MNKYNYIFHISFKFGCYFYKMNKTIISINNSLIKQIIKLQEKSRERKITHTFVTEGMRELSLALKGNYQIMQLLVCENVIQQIAEVDFLKQNSQEVIQITEEVYQKLAYRSTTEGVIGVLKTKTHALCDLNLKTNNSLLLVAEAPEKPGNIGALLRTADAAGVDGVIIANPKTDLYNPNVIRSSVGCLFTQNIATGNTKDILRYLKKHHFTIFSAALQPDSLDYLQADFTRATAIVVGTEDEGLTQEWLELSDQKIIIPMRGEIDSMNVSVAAAVVIFEAVRQRTIGKVTSR